MEFRGPLALEVLILCSTGGPRHFRSRARREGDEGVWGWIRAVADLGGKTLLDIVRVGCRGGGGWALRGRRRRRRRGKGETRERMGVLGLPVK